MLGILGFLFVLMVSLPWGANIYTDFLWFDSLGRSGVWATMMRARIGLMLVGTAVFFALLYGNLLLAERFAPPLRRSVGEDDLVDRYHEIVGKRAALVRVGMSVFLSIVVGFSLGTAWNQWLLYRNRVDFGQKDATFNTDIGFYVFQLPFLTTVATWLFSALILVLVLTVLSHVLNGGIRFDIASNRVTPQVKAHVSVLLGALALVQCGRYWLDRFELTFSTRGAVDGATYTDVNVQLRVLYLLMLIAVFAFALFIANIWRRGWVLPAMAVAMWIFVAALAGVLIPAFVQQFRVRPSESSKERPYIEHNIAATKASYGLADVDTSEFDWSGEVAPDDLEDNRPTLANVRLWDPSIVATSFQIEQENKGLYSITDVDVDRYPLADGETQVMVAARDLALQAEETSWENEHLAYTHGSGIVASAANAKTSSGEPLLVPEVADLEESRIYFGKQKAGYVIVNTEVGEIDGRTGEGTSKGYEGADGIQLGSGIGGFLRKSAFAIRFADINPLVSGNITGKSRVLLARDVSTRVEALAPFLAWDHDPYVVVIDGRVQYVIDGYTTTSNYPNAQRADTGGLDPESGLHGRSFRYARNSVKAVVDSYDGTVTMYVVDDDPIIEAYGKAFPTLFKDVDEAPEALIEHFRYPEDLFIVQTQMWAKYHVDNPADLYNRKEEWRIPKDPGVKQVQGGTTTRELGPDGQPISPNDLYQPQYVLMALPGDDDLSFVLMRPFAPGGRGATSQNQLTSFMVAQSDPDHYGELISYAMPTGSLPEGPNQAVDAIQADPNIGDLRRAQCTGESICQFTPPVLVPVGDGILYVQSMFVSGQSVQAPQLQRVIVSHQSKAQTKVGIGTTLRDALVDVFGDDVPDEVEDTKVTTPPPGSDDEPADPGDEPDEPGDTTTTSTAPEGDVDELESLIDRLTVLFGEADAALRDGDTVTYAERISDARDVVLRIEALRGDGDGASKGSESDDTSGESTTTTTEPGGA